MNSLLTTQAQSNFDQQYQNVSSIQTMYKIVSNSFSSQQLQQLKQKVESVQRRIAKLENETSSQIKKLRKQFTTQIYYIRENLKNFKEFSHIKFENVERKISNIETQLKNMSEEMSIRFNKIDQALSNIASSKSIGSQKLSIQETGYFANQQDETINVLRRIPGEQLEFIKLLIPQNSKGYQNFFDFYSMSGTFKKSTKKLMVYVSDQFLQVEAILEQTEITHFQVSPLKKQMINIFLEKEGWKSRRNNYPYQTQSITGFITGLIKNKQFEIFTNFVHFVIHNQIQLLKFAKGGIVLRTQNLPKEILLSIGQKIYQYKCQACNPYLITQKGKIKGSITQTIIEISKYVKLMSS